MATARTCAGCGHHPEPGERLSRASRLCGLCVAVRVVRNILAERELPPGYRMAYPDPTEEALRTALM